MTTMIEMPTKVAAGDTWSWGISASDYPAPTWSVTLVLWNTETRFSIDSTDDGTDHLIAQTAAESSARAPGVYQWKAFAKDPTHRFEIGAGYLTITPNVEGARPFDTRSHSRKMLAALEEALEQLKLGVKSYAIADRQWTSRDIPELIAAISSYELKVYNEDMADRSAAGLKKPRNIAVRFSRD
jgi:hypothetical protein